MMAHVIEPYYTPSPYILLAILAGVQAWELLHSIRFELMSKLIAITRLEVSKTLILNFLIPLIVGNNYGMETYNYQRLQILSGIECFKYHQILKHLTL